MSVSEPAPVPIQRAPMPTAGLPKAVRFWRWLAAPVEEVVRQLVGAARGIVYLRPTLELLRTPAYSRFRRGAPARGALFHLTHRHYLARSLTTRQRVEAALCHYRQESRRFGDDYLQAVYAGPGLELWHEERGLVRYRMVLRASPDLPHEGAVSVVLLAGPVVLCEMSFGWVDAGLFGLGPAVGPVIFVSRNQSVHFEHPALSAFGRHFPQQSPKYLCMSALRGVAAAHGCDGVVGVASESQIAFAPEHANSFRNSYCKFWSDFGGVVLPRHGLLMKVPPPLRTLSELDNRHRKRAAARRGLWTAITQTTALKLDALMSAHQPSAVVRVAPDSRAKRAPAMVGWVS